MHFTLRAFYTFLILFLAIAVTKVTAQPLLPDIAGSTQKGVVILTWNCQYEGLHSIAVQRSSDSVHNFITVGYVRDIKKGVQAFIDGHPKAGKNYYQLQLVFNSDLLWTSNHIRINVDSAVLVSNNMVLPPNDSLQKYLVIPGNPDRPAAKSKSGIVVTIDTGSNSSKPTGNGRNPNDQTIDNIVTSAGGGNVPANANGVPANAAAPDNTQKHNISISVSENSGDMNPYTYVKSHYIFTNPLTGHVDMELPQDASGTHKFSVKFYNQANEEVLDIPKLTLPQIVLDKRNFQKKGIYKFVLKKDNKELETGYITIY